MDTWDKHNKLVKHIDKSLKDCNEEADKLLESIVKFRKHLESM